MLFKDKETPKIGSLGGQATAKKLRKAALKTYYKNPSKCLYCNEVIKVEKYQKVQDARRKKFCNRSHAAKYNNKKFIKRPINYSIYGKCKVCKKDFPFTKMTNGTYNRRREFCPVCLKRERAKICAKRFHNVTNVISIKELTKKDLFKKYGYSKGRSMITKDARKEYVRANKPLKCAICKYKKFVQISHKKSVSEFSSNIKIREINDIKNLWALCPTHHWEYDHGELQCSGIE